MTTRTWIEMVVLFGPMAAISYRKQRYTRVQLVIPLVLLGYFALKHLRNTPSGGNNVYVLVWSIIVGLLLGLIWIMLTRITRHEDAIYLQGGLGSLILLAAAFFLRVIPIEWMTYHPSQTMHFALRHHVSVPGIVAPAFISLTAAMVLVRLCFIVIRTASLRREVSTSN